jgi:hypothetical protein
MRRAIGSVATIRSSSWCPPVSAAIAVAVTAFPDAIPELRAAPHLVVSKVEVKHTERVVDVSGADEAREGG